jgi:uncharacterized RDD family membrane protein YckC
MAFHHRRRARQARERLTPRDLLAPLSLRLCAYLLDFLMIAVTAELLSRALGIPPPRWLRLLSSPWETHPLFAGLYALYLVLSETAWGRTLGKAAFGLRVVNLRGENVSLWAAVVRNLLGYFERHAPAFGLLVALPAILLTPHRQRLGDLLARTVVVQQEALDAYRRQRAGEALPPAKQQA